jgi:hypothetical protein
MRTYQHTAFPFLDTYDTFYGGHRIDAATTVFIIELRDSVVFLVVQTELEICGLDVFAS